MLPTDILIVYKRNVLTDKHVCQLIYSITCHPIVKTISWRRNDDFTIFIYLFDLFLSSKILSSISFGGRFKALLVPTCIMRHSGLCRKIGFKLQCMSLTFASEKLFTLTLSFWDSWPETIESPATQIVPFGLGQSSLLSDVTLSFLAVSLIQIGNRMGSSLLYLFAELPYIPNIFHDFYFRNSVTGSLIDLVRSGFFWQRLVRHTFVI